MGLGFGGIGNCDQGSVGLEVFLAFDSGEWFGFAITPEVGDEQASVVGFETKDGDFPDGVYGVNRCLEGNIDGFSQGIVSEIQGRDGGAASDLFGWLEDETTGEGKTNDQLNIG